LPASTPGVGEWYTVKCTKPVIGTDIKVRNTRGTCLHFSSIKVAGKKISEVASGAPNQRWKILYVD
jgi:hypothetical protein